MPTFSSVWSKIGSENRQKGKTVKWVGREEEKINAKQAEGDGRGGRAKEIPEQGCRELES